MAGMQQDLVGELIEFDQLNGVPDDAPFGQLQGHRGRIRATYREDGKQYFTVQVLAGPKKGRLVENVPLFAFSIHYKG